MFVMRRDETWSLLILKAVNGPLQGRTAILDLDMARANAFPDDYETDLESEWSNPSKNFLSFLILIHTSPTKICLLMALISHGKQ
jgi:hypothetical protein